MISLSVLSLLIFFWPGFVKLQLWFIRVKNKKQKNKQKKNKTNKKKEKKKKDRRNTDFLCSVAVIYLAKNFIWIKVKNIKKIADQN